MMRMALGWETRTVSGGTMATQKMREGEMEGRTELAQAEPFFSLRNHLPPEKPILPRKRSPREML